MFTTTFDNPTSTFLGFLCAYIHSCNSEDGAEHHHKTRHDRETKDRNNASLMDTKPASVNIRPSPPTEGQISARRARDQPSQAAARSQGSAAKGEGSATRGDGPLQKVKVRPLQKGEGSVCARRLSQVKHDFNCAILVSVSSSLEALHDAGRRERKAVRYQRSNVQPGLQQVQAQGVLHHPPPPPHKAAGTPVNFCFFLLPV